MADKPSPLCNMLITALIILPIFIIIHLLSGHPTILIFVPALAYVAAHIAALTFNYRPTKPSKDHIFVLLLALFIVFMSQLFTTAIFTIYFSAVVIIASDPFTRISKSMHKSYATCLLALTGILTALSYQIEYGFAARLLLASASTLMVFLAAYAASWLRAHQTAPGTKYG